MTKFQYSDFCHLYRRYSPDGSMHFNFGWCATRLRLQSRRLCFRQRVSAGTPLRDCGYPLPSLSAITLASSVNELPMQADEPKQPQQSSEYASAPCRIGPLKPGTPVSPRSILPLQAWLYSLRRKEDHIRIEPDRQGARIFDARLRRNQVGSCNLAREDPS